MPRASTSARCASNRASCWFERATRTRTPASSAASERCSTAYGDDEAFELDDEAFELDGEAFELVSESGSTRTATGACMVGALYTLLFRAPYPHQARLSRARTRSSVDHELKA